MGCEHKWRTFNTSLDNEGYMIMKFCVLCYETNGMGFLDKEHEVSYLNSLLGDSVER